MINGCNIYKKGKAIADSVLDMLLPYKGLHN